VLVKGAYIHEKLTINVKELTTGNVLLKYLDEV
jgi:hypothetical protein